jgi:hypothetical protein
VLADGSKFCPAARADGYVEDPKVRRSEGEDAKKNRYIHSIDRWRDRACVVEDAVKSEMQTPHDRKVLAFSIS